MPEDKRVNMGVGMYFDRTGVCLRAFILLIIGVISLALGMLRNLS
jgi:hypothetical protein